MWNLRHAYGLVLVTASVGQVGQCRLILSHLFPLVILHGGTVRQARHRDWPCPYPAASRRRLRRIASLVSAGQPAGARSMSVGQAICVSRIATKLTTFCYQSPNAFLVGLDLLC